MAAPTRHALDWQSAEFYNEDSLYTELERVFDLCHGCRRCVSLCQSFPTLFDLVDESETMEVDGVDKADYMKVVDHCYLCDLCYMTKCPYTPPHEWNIDFPHLMLRAKAVKFKKGEVKARDKFLTGTDRLGKLASIPVVVNAVNASNKNGAVRKLMEKTLGVSAEARLPEYHQPLRKRGAGKDDGSDAKAGEATQGKVALFATCYGNYNAPEMGEDLIKVLQHNDIPVSLVDKEQCCGMPKLELGDLESVQRAKEANIPELVKWVDAGWDLMAPVPSCVLMFKQELPLMFPDDPDVQKVKEAIYDPFEYLMLREKEGLLSTDFKKGLGKVVVHAACHQRVQNIGPKTRDMIALVPDTEVELIERCSGHDGTYAVKAEFHQDAVKICRPVATRTQKAEADYFGSDCPMAGTHIEHVLQTEKDSTATTTHPISMLRIAYDI